MTAMAELTCHSCGARTKVPVSRRQPDSMPKCSCGGYRQVVRIVHERELSSDALAGPPASKASADNLPD